MLRRTNPPRSGASPGSRRTWWGNRMRGGVVSSRLSRWAPPWIRDWAVDSGVLLLSQAATIAATSALAILIARSLNPHDWGIFSGFLALSLALSAFGEFGLSTWLLRELSEL